MKLPEEKEKEQQAQSHETAKQMEKNISPTKKYSTDRAGKKKNTAEFLRMQCEVQTV